MKTAQQDLTTGPLGKQIMVFSIPLILSNLLQVLFNMADVAVVGRFAGSVALGAVGSTTILVSLFTGFLIGLSGGVNVLAAHHFGAGDRKRLSDTVHSAALVSAAVGILLLVAGCGFARVILVTLHTKAELIGGAVRYFRIYCLGMPALAMSNFGNAVFSAVGNTRRPLCYLSVAGVVNVVLNLLFVIVCKLDVAGVAIASIISQYLSAVLVLVVAWLIVRRHISGRLGVFSAMLIMAGGVGNLIDRVLFGYVTDMFQTLFMDFPVFNVADCCITVGVVLLFIYVLFFYDKGKKKEDARDDAGDLPSDGQ